MKDISDQEVIDHLKRLNRWWSDPAAVDPESDVLRPRAYLEPVRQLVLDASLRRAVVLLGPRRVGKTILIRHLIRDLIGAGVPARRIAYVEMDHPLLRGRTLEPLAGLIAAASGDPDSGVRYLLFDEIQYLKDWERHLKALVDHRPELRILVSGSAAAALKRRSDESGAGRFTDFLLPPLTFPEYLNLATRVPAMHEVEPGRYVIDDVLALNEQFVDYVNFGGYPELALSPAVRSDPARFVKSDIVDKVLLRDLPQLYGIQDIQELNALFTLLAYNTAEVVSLEALSQRCGVGKATIGRYIEYLEAAFLLRRVFRVDQSGRRYQRERGFKVFLTNPAMRTGLFGPVGADGEGFGHLVETAVFAQRFHEDIALNYARWGTDDLEVDMVESDRALRPTLATEIKWSDSHVDRPADLQGLLRFCRNSALGEGWVGTRSRFATATVGDVRLQFWPTAVLAFHYGMRGIRGRIAHFEAKLAK